MISPSSSRERGRDGERINDAREMDGKPLVEPREGDGRSICCKDIEAEVKIAYLSCPKVILKHYFKPMISITLKPLKGIILNRLMRSTRIPVYCTNLTRLKKAF